MRSLTYLSLGAGVQSTALYVLSTLGKTPPADVAIFADTQDEPAYVYEHLERLKAWGVGHGGPPIETVTAGCLSADTLARTSPVILPLPVYVRGDGATGAPIRRTCTYYYKIKPIRLHCKRRLGIPDGTSATRDTRVIAQLGISRDEATRMKPSDRQWITNTWPLIDAMLSRADCLSELARLAPDLPLPQRSACVYCPYHSAGDWRQYRDQYPEEWDRAVAFERALQAQTWDSLSAPPYLSRWCVPLDQAPIDGDPRQRGLWDEDCAGICGV
jgi:hypothetical protein